jgi:phosphatidylinositol alpha-mannosyltransferase
MKIALVSPYDFSFPGGLTSHISQLAQQFIANGHEIKILAPFSPSMVRNLGLEVIPLGRPIPFPSGGSIARVSLSLWLLPRIRKILEKEKFDVIHLHEPMAPLLPLCILHTSTTINVGTFHAFHGSNRWYRLSHILLKKWANKLDGRIAVSPPALQHVSKFFPGEYKIIPNGIDVNHFAKDSLQPIQELQDGKVNLLFVSRLEKRKGLRYLLEAYSKVRWDFPNTRLIVVGPGTPDKLSYRVISERNLQDHVIFTGPVPYGELPRYYKTADIFCAPATGKESFGIILLEAMATSKPIVATRIEGFSSVLTHGHEAVLVPPKDTDSMADAISLLIRNPDLRDNLGNNGSKMSERYDWKVVAQEVFTYYQKLISEKQKAIEPKAV